MTVVGLATAQRLLEQLGTKTMAKVGPKAARAGSAPALRAARALCPVDSRTLRQSLTTVVRRYKSASIALVSADMNKQPKKGATAERRRARAGGLSRRGLAPPVHLVESPVRAHAIRAKRAPRLVFIFHGKLVRVAAAAHGGHQGARFLERSGQQSMSQQRLEFERKLGEEVYRELPEAPRIAT